MFRFIRLTLIAHTVLKYFLYKQLKKIPDARRESSLRAKGMVQSVLLYSLLFAPCALQASTLQRGDRAHPSTMLRAIGR